VFKIEQTASETAAKLDVCTQMPKWRFSMPMQRNNLLIVEDDAQLRSLLTAILTSFGYRVRVAEDGFAALAQIRADIPDLILSDLYMRGMSGFELLSIVRRRFPEITVVAMSSAFSAGAIPHGVAADAFYQKATGVPSLLTLVADSVRRDILPEQRPRNPSPIWIAAHPTQPDAEGHVVITCPECLRTSAHAPIAATGTMRDTHCTHCKIPIRYAMVQTTDPGPPSEQWRIPSCQSGSNSASP
jgi:CheY-like chemotaxis protein